MLEANSCWTTFLQGRSVRSCSLEATAARAWGFCSSTRILSISPVWSARFTVAKIAISSSRSVWQLCVSCRLQCPVSGSIFVRQFLQATYMGLPKTEVTCDAKKQCVRRFYKQRLLHTHTFTPGEFYTKTLLHADACTHRRFYTQTLLHKHIHTQRLLHTEAFTHRRFYTQKLLHRETFTHRRFYTQTLSHTDAFTHKHFYAQRPGPWNRNFTSVLCDRTSFRAKAFRLDKRNRNFTPVFGDRTLFRAKRLRRIPQNRNFTSVFDVQRPFRANGLRRTPQNRTFTSVFDVQRPFRAKVLRRTNYRIASLLQFLAIEPHFVRKGCAGTREIAILP